MKKESELKGRTRSYKKTLLRKSSGLQERGLWQKKDNEKGVGGAEEPLSSTKGKSGGLGKNLADKKTQLPLLGGGERSIYSRREN